MEEDAIRDRIQQYADSLDNTIFYYTLRKMRIKVVSRETVESVKQLYALHHFGLPIDALRLAFLRRVTPGAALQMLHRFGDYNVLVVVRGSKIKELRYLLAPQFIDAIEKHINIGSDYFKLTKDEEQTG